MVPYKITWFRRGWVGLSQLIWVIVVPMPGHLDVYSRSGRTYSEKDEEGTRDGIHRRTYKAAHGRFGQFYRQFYRRGLSFTGTRMEFTGCL